MLEAAHKAATRAKPGVKLISGAIARDKIETFLPALAAAGVDRYVDGIGIYPGTAPLSPEDGFMDVVLSRAQRVRQQEQIRAPLWALDLTWPTGPMNHVSEFEQALYLPRAYVLCRAQGVDHIILTACHDEAHPVRDSADLIYRDGSFFGIKPAAIAARVTRQTLDSATFLREVFLSDRWEGLSRGYLFQTAEGRILLAAWRREGQSVLTLPAPALSVIDSFGNAVTPASGPDGKTVILGVDPLFVLFDARDGASLAQALERRSLQYDDASESAWKRAFTFHLDVGNPEDEKAADYAIAGGRLVGPIDSFYHNEYGQHVVDSGRHFKTEESFSVDVTGYGDADMIIRKRINYAVPNQNVMVYCNGEPVGQWFAYKRDRRYRWRDIEFIIPNRLFKGEPTADLRFEAMGGAECTSYYYWAGPLQTKTLDISDLSLLVGTSGWGHHVSCDKNILGGPISFFKRPNQAFPKGIGSNAAGTLADSLIVLSLNKQFKRFKATVGVDTAADGQGTVRFRISNGTRNLLFDSGDMNFYTEPKEVDIDVSDSIILLLWIDDTGDGNLNDLANWASARLEAK